MIKSRYTPRSVSSSNRKTYSIDQFLGVDYSTHKFQIENNRAIDILNYVYRDGVIQNRHGITQILKIKPTTYIKQQFDNTFDYQDIYINDTNFNSMWQFIGEDNEKHIIAHIGNLLYEIKNIDDEFAVECIPLASTKYNNIPVCYQIENYKSQAFVGGNKLWLLGGNKYMVIRFLSNNVKIISPVESSDLIQIPTTSINITYDNAIVSGRSQLDNANLLTKWRKNTLLSGKGKNESEISSELYEYTLDSPIILEKDLDINEFEMIISERGVL